MKLTTILALTTALGTSTLSAQPTMEVIGRYVRVNPHGSNSFSDLGTEYRQSSGNGFGAAINVYVAKPVSIELGYNQIDSDARLNGTMSLPLGSLKMRPLTAALQWHPMAQTTIDPYVGGGAMYMMFDSLHGNALNAIGIDQIHFKDRFGPMLNAGIAFGFMQSFAIGVDAKYSPLKSTTTARFTSGGPQSDPLDIKINPLLFSAGVRLRF